MKDNIPLEQFVASQLATGFYASYDDMVEKSLRLLQAHQEEMMRIAELLRPAVESYQRGEPGLPLDAEDIIRRGMEQMKLGDGAS